MSEVQTPKSSGLKLRMAIFPAVIAGLLGIIFMRLWYYQVIRGPEIAKQAPAQSKRVVQSHSQPSVQQHWTLRSVARRIGHFLGLRRGR